MPQPSDVDVWLGRETPRVRKALESASKHFDGTDALTVHTLEAVYARESSFGTMLGARGSSTPAGHFHLSPDVAERYHLTVSKQNDQRFDINYASSAAARYLKDLNSMFSKETRAWRGINTIPVKSVSERKKFTLAAYNGGEGRIARAQRLAEQTGKDPQSWVSVETFLESAGATTREAREIRQYIELVPLYEIEFARKSPAKNSKQNKRSRGTTRCTEGHWVTIDRRPVFICG